MNDVSRRQAQQIMGKHSIQLSIYILKKILLNRNSWKVGGGQAPLALKLGGPLAPWPPLFLLHWLCRLLLCTYIWQAKSTKNTARLRLRNNVSPRTSWFSRHVLILMQDVVSHARRLGSLISTRLSQDDCQKTHERVWLASMASQVYQKYSTTTTSKQRVTKDIQDVLVLSTRLDTHARRLDTHARRLGSLISTRLSQDDCQKTHERVWLARVHVTSRNCTCALTK